MSERVSVVLQGGPLDGIVQPDVLASSHVIILPYYRNDQKKGTNARMVRYDKWLDGKFHYFSGSHDKSQSPGTP